MSMAHPPTPQTAFAGTLAIFLPAVRPPASPFPPLKTPVPGHWLVGRRPATLVATRGSRGGVALQVHAAGRPLVSLSSPAAATHAALLPPAATGGDWVLAVSARVAAGDAAPSLTAKWAFRFASPGDGAAAAAALAALRRRVVVGTGVSGAGLVATAGGGTPPRRLPTGPALIAAVASLLASPGLEACVERVARDVAQGCG